MTVPVPVYVVAQDDLSSNPFEAIDLLPTHRIVVPYEHVEKLTAKIDHIKRSLNDLDWLNCVDDCEGFRDPCAACVVHETLRMLNGWS